MTIRAVLMPLSGNDHEPMVGHFFQAPETGRGFVFVVVWSHGRRQEDTVCKTSTVSEVAMTGSGYRFKTRNTEYALDLLTDQPDSTKV